MIEREEEGKEKEEEKVCSFHTTYSKFSEFICFLPMSMYIFYTFSMYLLTTYVYL
jgi:hypothetical protein